MKDEIVKLYAISVDPSDVSKNFAEKIASDGKGKVSFPLLSDPDHKVIDTYGLRDPAYKGQNVEVEGTILFDYLIFASDRRLATERVIGFFEDAHHLLDLNAATKFGESIPKVSRRTCRTRSMCRGGYTIPTKLRIGWYFGTNDSKLKASFSDVPLMMLSFADRQVCSPDLSRRPLSTLCTDRTKL
jgi:hypothetical protein